MSNQGVKIENREGREHRERLERVEREVHHLAESLERLTRRVDKLEHPPSTVTRAVLTFGASMPGAITVDTVNETVTVSFEDDHGNPTVAPDGATVTYTSDNEAVATVAADPSNPLQGDVTPVSIGSANISAALANALEADGVTEIPDPSPVAVTVSAGAANQAALVLSV